jgi:integrase
LSSLKDHHSSAIRDRAIILLLAVYGLRAGEVAGLRLEDFDWERELLRVRRPKQRKAQEYPLVGSVGDAVVRYLRKVRPASERREIFLTCRAPYRPLHSGTLWPVVARRLRGLGVKLPHYGPHCLRHACATRLLHQGLSLKEIGDHLGHTNPETTRIYAKVDLAKLREVGQINLRGLA